MSKIEWTDCTWNVLAGCSKVSQGCAGCYAIKDAHRLAGNPNPKIAAKYAGTTTPDGKNWTGKITFSEDVLEKPLRWSDKPRRVFVNSMSDLFHESVSDEQIGAIFGVMMATPHITYQILTKRPQRMFDWFEFVNNHESLMPREYIKDCGLQYVQACHLQADMSDAWPLPNVWLGISAEDQPTFEKRWDIMRQVPAAKRFISFEPLLGGIDMQSELWEDLGEFIWPDWIIVGGESGHGARPMHPEWARSLRDQCQSAGIPFFFKQWGEWCEAGDDDLSFKEGRLSWLALDGSRHLATDAYYTIEGNGNNAYRKRVEGTRVLMARVGKKEAGRLLEDKEWNQFPIVKS